MGKFKVGDRVRIVSGPNNGGFGQIGDAGVIEIADKSSCRVRFETGGRSGEAWYVGFDYLEPVAVAQQPQPPAKEPLRIQPGRYYLTRDGRKVGPMRRWSDEARHRWEADDEDLPYIWADDGTEIDSDIDDSADLVAEASSSDTNGSMGYGSTAGFTIPVEAYAPEPDATLTTKITVDFSDFDAELDRIFGRLRKLKRKAGKLGISLDASRLQDAA